MIGRMLGQYRVLEELGGGGMGTVYRAHDTTLGRDVAIKVLSLRRSMTPGDTERFLKEARAAAALRHQNICTVYEVGEVDGTRYISMAYIPGRNLEDVIGDGPLPAARAIAIAMEIAGALQAAHRAGIVHRDVKPANVIIDADGHATMLDFGVAKLAGHATQPGDGPPTGTVAYMSPEQAGGGAVDHRTDIWSLGVCLYEMLAGRLPFRGEHYSAVIYQIINQDPESFSSIGVEVPPSLEQVVARAMEKRPNRRYQSTGEVLADLERVRRDLDAGVGNRQPSIAVLRFNNMSADPQQDYFCEGMAEEIINNLVHVEGMRVAARTSSFAYRDSKMDVREIGRKLGVDTVLEGSVQKSGERVRINAQLINVGDGYHLWSRRYDRDLEDVFVIQDEIARSIVEALEVTLTETEEDAIEHVPTRDMRAYDLYMRGLHHYHQADRRGIEIARNMYTSAIIHDPDYALAYCGLADCYSMIVSFYDRDSTHIENALTASEKAISIDPGLAEAHASRGLALSLDGRFDEAHREFAEAAALSPRLYEAHYFHARAARQQGNLELAATLFVKASEVRPEDYQAPILAADTFRGLDRPDDVARWFKRGLAAAEKHVELHPGEARAWYLGAHAQYELGNLDKAREWNEKAMALGPRDSATLYNAACLFALIGDSDRCFDCFHRAVEHGFSNRRWLETDPDLESIRSDPRYAELIAEIDSGRAR